MDKEHERLKNEAMEKLEEARRELEELQRLEEEEDMDTTDSNTEATGNAKLNSQNIQ